MIDWSSCTEVERDPERVSGAWVFRGTRIPVAGLFENLEDGASAKQFVEWFPASHWNKSVLSSTTLPVVLWLPHKCAFYSTKARPSRCVHHRRPTMYQLHMKKDGGNY